VIERRDTPKSLTQQGKFKTYLVAMSGVLGSYPWIVKSTGMVNHFYFYCVDEDFGPFFIKFCSYFPYNAKLCLFQRQPLGPVPGGQGRDRVHPAGQRVRHGRGPGRVAADL